MEETRQAQGGDTAAPSFLVAAKCPECGAQLVGELGGRPSVSEEHRRGVVVLVHRARYHFD